MDFFIAAQDINSIEFALFQNSTFVKKKQCAVNPEAYLKSLVETLTTWKASVLDIKCIFVIVGPGSFTASRVSTTIANTLAFALGIPIIGFENSEYLSMEKLIKKLDMLPISPDRFVCPSYHLPPHITKKKI